MPDDWTIHPPSDEELDAMPVTPGMQKMLDETSRFRLFEFTCPRCGCSAMAATLHSSLRAITKWDCLGCGMSGKAEA